jgi:raffinose/stachyose/melibiose transport system substrate-binding protein
MSKKTMATTLAGAMMLSLALSACGGGSDSASSPSPDASGGAASSAPKKNVTFTIGYATGDPASKQGLADSIAAFTKANPHIKITDLSEGGSAAYLDWLKTKDAVGEFPDLVEMRDTQLFADANKIAELPTDLQGLFENLPKVNDKIYVAPIAGNAPRGIIYSKKAYTSAGITAEPKTYDEFLANQEKLKATGIAPIVMGGKDIFHWGFWMDKFFIDNVFSKDLDWNSKRSAGQASFTDAGPMKAMTELTDLFTKGYVDKGYLSTADNQTASMLVTGKAAQLYSGPWMFTQIQQADPKFEFGWYPLPDHEGKVNVFGLPSPSGWAMSTKASQDADKQEAIKEFIKFFFSKDQYTKFLKATSAIPTTKEKMTYDTSPQMQRVLEVMNDSNTVKALGFSNFWGNNQAPQQFRNWFYKLAQEWLTKGDFSVEYMKKADAEWDNQVKANKK